MSPLIARLAARDPRGVALRTPVEDRALRAWTWAELDELARRHGAWLRSRNIGAGDRVGVRTSGDAAAVAMLLAHLRLGVIHVAIGTKASAAEVEHIQRDAELALQLDGGGHLGGADMIEPLGAWPAPPSADAIALLIYTSGTTGKPKGVMLSHAALAANLGAVAEAWRFDTRDVVVNMLPLHHVHGLGLATLATLLAGAAVELHPRFDAPTLVAAIAGGATVFMGVPTMYHLLLEHLGRAPADADVLRRARLFTAGSAALPAAAFARFAALTGHHILERYGMTETLFTLSNPYDGPRVPGAVGQPIAGVTVRLVDEFGAPAGAGPGEIEVRGDGLMTGYWQRPAATAAAFRDGWFRTGDTAVIEAGSYRIVGRTSTDIIKSGGYKLGAREIEDAIVGTGLVSECAVLGVPDEKWGELVGAVCVPAAGAPTEPAALLAALHPRLRDVLAEYKLPRRLVIVDELPRNAMGKVQKAQLRGAFA